jgi:hypothetical protein
MLCLRLVLAELFVVLRRMDPCCCSLVWLGRGSEKMCNLIVCGRHICKYLSTSIEEHVKTILKGEVD